MKIKSKFRDLINLDEDKKKELQQEALALKKNNTSYNILNNINEIIV